MRALLGPRQLAAAAMAAGFTAIGANRVSSGTNCLSVTLDDAVAKTVQQSISKALASDDAKSRKEHHTVLVTGASGFIASHIVSQLLARGYVVHGTVRDAADPVKTAHLQNLEGAPERLKLYSADLTSPGCFDEAIRGCDAVVHTATPLSVKFSKGAIDGEKDIFDPALSGLHSILNAVTGSGGQVRTFVLTSSMSAMAPRPEPRVKTEAHWSDPDDQKARGNWYGAAKTCQEQIAAAALPEMGVRYCAICPTMVLGPMLHLGNDPVSTMGRFATWVMGGIQTAPNDSMSFVDVRDCAAMHVAALEQPTASGRYMCLAESLHWNDIRLVLRELHPAMPPISPFEGGPLARVTQFDRSKQDSLGVAVRGTRDVLADAVQELRTRGLLEGTK